MKNIDAISFTPRYDQVEDRIRLAINYNSIENRVDFMLTRSFILRLFPTCDDFMLKHYNYDKDLEALETPKNNAQPKQTTKPKPLEKQLTSKTDTTDLKLYQQNDELIMGVNF